MLVTLCARIWCAAHRALFEFHRPDCASLGCIILCRLAFIISGQNLLATGIEEILVTAFPSHTRLSPSPWLLIQVIPILLLARLGGGYLQCWWSLHALSIKRHTSPHHRLYIPLALLSIIGSLQMSSVRMIRDPDDAGYRVVSPFMLVIQLI